MKSRVGMIPYKVNGEDINGSSASLRLLVKTLEDEGVDMS